MPKHLMLTTLAAGMAAAIALPAAAQPVNGVTVTARGPAGMQVQSQRVRFADIDPYTADGAHRLLMRVSRAAEDVCSPAMAYNVKNLREYDDYRDYQRCKSDGIRLTLAEVNTPAVAALLPTVSRY